MKRISLIACAIAFGVMAAAPAKADVDIIRWSGSHWCQIWDNAAGDKPWPEDYVRVAGGFATWADAFAALNTLVAERKCGW